MLFGANATSRVRRFDTPNSILREGADPPPVDRDHHLHHLPPGDATYQLHRQWSQIRHTREYGMQCGIFLVLAWSCRTRLRSHGRFAGVTSICR